MLLYVKDGMFNNLEFFMGLSVENCRVLYMLGNFLFGFSYWNKLKLNRSEYWKLKILYFIKY